MIARILMDIADHLVTGSERVAVRHQAQGFGGVVDIRDIGGAAPEQLRRVFVQSGQDIDILRQDSHPACRHVPGKVADGRRRRPVEG